MRIDCYVDADFVGLLGYEDKQDSYCVKSRTGYVIYIYSCLVVWVSKLQSDIATSTMEAKYNALSMAMRNVLPLKHLVKEISNAIGLPNNDGTGFVTIVHEDNNGALKIATMKPGQMTPRSKHYGVKYHWFCSQLKPNNITIKQVDTDKQQADFLTKAL